MRKLLLALALTLLSALPAAAQSYSSAYLAGTDATTQVKIDGQTYASVIAAVSGTATSTLTWEMSVDGTNWVAAPYGKRTDASSANPTTAATLATTGAVSQVWEIPIPATATNVRVRMSSWTSGTLTVGLSPGRTAGATSKRIRATLYDVTNLTTVTPTTGVLDTSGWSNVLVWTAGGTTSTPSAYAVDSAGASSTLALWTAGGGATKSWVTFGGGAILVSTSSTFFGGAGAAVPDVPARLNVNGVQGTTTRIVVEAGR